MALFKIEKGLAKNLATNRPNTVEGYCYVTTDDGKFYIDTATGTGISKRIVLNAGSADKLTTNAGSSTNPVYFSGGVPVATGYNLSTMQSDINDSISGLSVSGKVITYTKNNGDTGTITTQDTNTTYSAATQSAAGLMSAADKKKLDGIATGATANTGDITGVTAGSGLTGGGSSGSVTLNVGAGDGISVTDNAVSLAEVGTAGTYGPTADITGSNGTTIKVPQITTDEFGRVTAITERTYTSKDTNTTYTLSSFGITATAAELNKLDGVTATTAELNYVDGVTSNIQTQLNGKLSTSGGTLTGNLSGQYITGTWLQSTANNHSNNTATKICIQDGSGRVYYRTPDEIKSDLGLANALHFIGEVDALPESATNGDVVLLGSKEYVYSDGWTELGDGDSHALKTITITGTNGLTGSGTLAGNVTLSHADTSSQSSVTASGRKYITGVSLDGYGHVTGLTTGTETVTDTHYTTGITAGATGTTSNSATTNGNTYIKVKDNSTHRSQIKITGSGATTVTSDANGVITISSTDNNTTYGAAGSSLGLMKTGGVATISSGQVTAISEAEISGGLASETLGVDGSTIDINTLYEYDTYKFYNLSSLGNYTNLPSGVESTGMRIAVCAYPISSSSFAQELTVNNERKYFRYSNGTSTWYDWKVLNSTTAGTAVGSSTQPVYIAANGTPTACTYTLGKSVPANAVFTDTTYTSLKNPYALTIQGNGTTLTNGIYDGSAAKTVNITPSAIGAAPTAHASTATTYGIGTSSNYGHVKLSDSTSSASAASAGIAASPKAVKTVYDAAAKLDSANTFSATNTFNGAIIIDSTTYGASTPSTGVIGQLFFVEDDSTEVWGLPSGGQSGQYLMYGTGDGDAVWTDFSLNAYENTDGIYGLVLSIDSEGKPNYDTNIYTSGHVLQGAAWNDYAEYRNQKEIIEPGYCVASSDNGQVYKTTEKFQACDGIVSDTFGFAIGQTKESRTPLAVAGRVLAYYEGNREDYHAGDTVCAGPEGKVCKMTREEIREWPDRIIGIVSEIPEYEVWGQNDIKVNNRIWIKIK